MIIVDTSVWVSLLVEEDSNHRKANDTFLSLKYDDVILTEYIYTESLNVLRAKFSQENCNSFIQLINTTQLSISFADHVITRLATEYFFQFKKLSFTDCLILASAKINDYEIATFDEDLKNASKLALAK
ncbi:MAG: type II toxin-antitoxin system VapC family toxin [Candidatus Peregrinibacteria bacterium]|nr:type II toxin-antitoxin system VapC family toxin [Candidatus Peregrinibacteria bacterium]